MDVKSAFTQQSWLSPKKEDDSKAATIDKPARDEAEEQIHRALADVLRCQNLVVLAGLGTSLCVMDGKTPPSRKAPTMPDLWKWIKDKTEKEDWDQTLALVHQPKGSENIEELLSRCKSAESFFVEPTKGKIAAFVVKAESMIRKAVDFISDSDELPVHGEFLRRIARRSISKARAKVFTTNYDLCFERAAKDGRFVLVDGFSPTLPPTFDPVYFTYDIVRRGSEQDASAFIPNVFHLYKLHGSIEWERGERVIEKKMHPDHPLLIYPRSSKYEQAFSQPYLEMMAALQAALREPNTGLLVIGFGFNDNHIAEPILSAIRSNLGLKAVIVDPALVSVVYGEDVEDAGEALKLNAYGNVEILGTTFQNPYLADIERLIDQGDARLTFIRGTFEDVTRAMPDITSETDLEKHMDRLRKTNGGSQ